MSRNRGHYLALSAFVLCAPACGGGGENDTGQGGTSGNGGSTSGAAGGGTAGTSGTSGSNSTGGSGTSGSGTTGGSSGDGGGAGAGRGGTTGGTTAGDAGRSGASGTAGAGGTAGVGGTTNGGADSGGRGGRAGQGGESGQPCSTLANGATPVSETQRTGPVPAPMGGTLSDGTYHLTAWNVYAPATADADLHAATLRFASGTYEIVVDGTARQSGSVSTAGVLLTFAASCPTATPIMKPYTANGTTLSLSTVSENRVETFTRQ